MPYCQVEIGYEDTGDLRFKIRVSEEVFVTPEALEDTFSLGDERGMKALVDIVSQHVQLAVKDALRARSLGLNMSVQTAINDHKKGKE